MSHDSRSNDLNQPITKKKKKKRERTKKIISGKITGKIVKIQDKLMAIHKTNIVLRAYKHKKVGDLTEKKI